MHLTRSTWYQASYLTTYHLLHAVGCMSNDIFPPAFPSWLTSLDLPLMSHRTRARKRCRQAGRLCLHFQLVI